MLVFATGHDFVVAEVVAQLAAILEHVLPASLVDNPLDIAEEVQSVGKRVKQDKKVLDRLCMGKGMTDKVERPAEFASYRIRSFQMLTQEGKKMRVLDPATMNQNLLLRVHQVAEVSVMMY